MPESSTTIENTRPMSLVKVMSPYQSVDLTLSVQYKHVSLVKSRSS